MTRYDDIRAHERFEKLAQLSGDELRALAAEHPSAPLDDYIEFLATVGAGEVGDGSFMLYDGLVPPADIYGEQSTDGIEDLWIIGDDFQGYSVGFDPKRNWAVVEIDPISHEADVIDESFERFVRRRLMQYGD